ncbi:MAG: hypothetical protein ACT4OX_02705 [Actinomycetota bacterium]
MPSTVLTAGIATAIGSLAHHDARAAAALVTRCLPELPAAPQLPNRREGVVTQWLHGVPGVEILDDDTLVLTEHGDPLAPVCTDLTVATHGGLLAFVDEIATVPRAARRVKAQVTGPLTLGVALTAAGLAPTNAFPLAARAAGTWARAVEDLFAQRLPDAALVLFFDEPALVCWRGDGEPPLDREVATDMLSSALASIASIGGVHVCGAGDLRMALAAGPDVVHFDVDAFSLDDATALTRFVDGGGWVAWGAVPTHGPIGEHPAPLWKALVDVWCELTRRGCDPVRLRNQALVAPACGLAGHGPSQAERAMLLARELGNMVRDQAAATKLAVGA